MARHKKFQLPPEDDPVMDISSLIDCCFLLLIYFLVATTIVQENKLDIEMPASTAASSTPPILQPGTIKVMADGSIEWGKGESRLPVAPPDPGVSPDNKVAFSQMRHCPQLVEQLKELKATADAAGGEAKAIVMLHSDPNAKHQRIMDVMAALTEAGIKSVGLNKIADEPSN